MAMKMTKLKSSSILTNNLTNDDDGDVLGHDYDGGHDDEIEIYERDHGGDDDDGDENVKCDVMVKGYDDVVDVVMNHLNFPCAYSNGNGKQQS